ncbi:MAG: hypothetical protein V9E81_02195 [Marmoricola sp.]
MGQPESTQKATCWYFTVPHDGVYASPDEADITNTAGDSCGDHFQGCDLVRGETYFMRYEPFTAHVYDMARSTCDRARSYLSGSMRGYLPKGGSKCVYLTMPRGSIVAARPAFYEPFGAAWSNMIFDARGRFECRVEYNAECKLEGPAPHKLVAMGSDGGRFQSMAVRVDQPKGCKVLPVNAWGSTSVARLRLPRPWRMGCYKFETPEPVAQRHFRWVGPAKSTTFWEALDAANAGECPIELELSRGMLDCAWYPLTSRQRPNHTVRLFW